jgi:hypothetical protein
LRSPIDVSKLNNHIQVYFVATYSKQQKIPCTQTNRYDVKIGVESYDGSRYEGSGLVFLQQQLPFLPKTEPQATCITMEDDLKKAIATCKPKMNDPSCIIDIC